MACWLAVLAACVLLPGAGMDPRPSGTWSLKALLPGSAVSLQPAPALALVLLSLVTGWLCCPPSRSALDSAGSAGTESRPPTWHIGLLFAIVLAGAAVRLYGIDFGLPQTFHPDEPRKVQQVLWMSRHADLNPRLFYHPALLLYSTLALSKVLVLLTGQAMNFSLVLIAGRLVSAAAGSLSVLFLYFIARSLGGRHWSLAAAGLMAAAPLAVTCSRYMKEDSLFVAASLVAVLFWIRSIQGESRNWMLLTGGAVGVACSAKYTGLLLLPLLVLGPWISSTKGRGVFGLARRSALALALAGLVFLVLNPFALLNPHQAASGFLFEARHASGGHYSTDYQEVAFKVGPWSQLWMYHIGRSLIPGLTLWTAILSLVGAGLLLRRRRLGDLVVVGLGLLFLVPAEMALSKPHPQPERYVLAVLPFLCLAAALLFQQLRGAGKPLLVALLTVLALAGPLVRSLQLAADLRDDTRLRLVSWVDQHLPAGSRIFLDGSPTYSGNLVRRRFHCRYGPLTLWPEKQKRGFEWFVESSFASGRFFLQPNNYQDIRRNLLELRAEAELVREFRANSGSYGFHNPLLRLYRLPSEASRETTSRASPPH